MPRDPVTLAEAVAAWIRAEHHFRFGPNAYRQQELDWYVKAERRLRRALTGKGNLEEAYQAMGDGGDDA